MNAIEAPFPTLFDKAGQPLDEGYVYIGIAGANAIANPVPIYWDADGSIPAIQPLRTVNGYISHNGAVAKPFIGGDYSIAVKDKRGELVYSSISARAGGSAEMVFATLADLKADETLVAGAYVGTLGYYAAGDQGAALYLIQTAAAFAATPNGLSDHMTAGGLVAVLQARGGVYIAEQWGAGFGVEVSGILTAMNAAAMAYNNGGEKPVTFKMHSAVNLKSAVTIGGSGASYFDIDISGSTITLVTGGGLNTTQKALTVSVKNSRVDCAKLIVCDKIADGYNFTDCDSSRIYGPAVEHVVSEGILFSGSNSNTRLYGCQGNEWKPSDAEFNTESNFVASVLAISSADMFVYDIHPGWSKNCIYLKLGAANVHITDCHPFNGNPQADGTPAHPKRFQPTIILCEAVSACYVYGGYMDNGYIKDKTGLLRMNFAHHLRLSGRVDMPRPYYRMVLSGDPSDRGVVSNYQNGTIGVFQSDLVTPDPNYQYLYDNTDALGATAGLWSLYSKKIEIVSGGSSEEDVMIFTNGTRPYWERIVTNNGATPAQDIIDLKWSNGHVKTNAAWLTNGKNKMGYDLGAGLSSAVDLPRSGTVTLNAPTGRLYFVAAAGSSTPFTVRVNNSFVDQADTVFINQVGGANVYDVVVRKQVAPGSFDVVVSAKYGGTVNEAITLDFVLIAGAWN